jgi:NADPH-dependent 2,4-dienoyl-CoA reductase/sulfur reductase-like enzyme
MSCTGVHFKTNTKVTGADVKSHTLTTETGDTISYEKLIVATGSGVRTKQTFTPMAMLVTLPASRRITLNIETCAQACPGPDSSATMDTPPAGSLCVRTSVHPKNWPRIVCSRV